MTTPFSLLSGAGQFAAYPMGPKLRAQLGISDSVYAGDSAETPTIDEQEAFESFLMLAIEEREIDSRETMTDLIEEFVGMAMPMIALRLADLYPEKVNLEDFRTLFQLGNAAMLGGDLGRAEEWFRGAQGLLPEEPAPYVNLAQLFLHDGRDEDARVWILAGLEAEPNNTRLWELLAVLYQQEFSLEAAPRKLLALAEERGSWAGMSLACDLIDPEDALTKLARLDKIYFGGERSHDFLIELTAVMGAAGRYDAIPSVVWQAEKLNTAGLPWQLHLHVAQAHLGLGKNDLCKDELAKALKNPQLPPSVREVIAQIEQEAAGGGELTH